MRALGLVARRPANLLRLRLLPPCGLARRCSSVTTGAVLTRADAATVSSSTAPGPILVDSASGVVPGRPAFVADSAAGVVPAAGGETGVSLTTVPIPPELAVVPIPMGPALPEGGAAQLPIDDIPGWFFATNGYFSLPMKGLEGFFATVHDVTGAPWWASIMLSTLMIRGALLPLIVIQQRNVAGMAKIKPQLDDLGARLKEAYARESIELANKLQSQMNTLMTENNVRPFSTMLGALVQIPLWMTFFFTLRGILARTHDPHGFNEGGALWFPDLTVADPYYILPVVTGGTFFAMASVDLMGTGGPVDEKQQMMKTGMKAVALLMIPMTASFESGVFVYWTTSNVMTVAQAQLLKNTQVRALIGMPPMMVPLPEGVTAAKYAAAAAEIVVPTTLFSRPPGLALAEMPKKQRPLGQRKKKRR